mgnify:CR=1 FL=1
MMDDKISILIIYLNANNYQYLPGVRFACAINANNYYYLSGVRFACAIN